MDSYDNVIRNVTIIKKKKQITIPITFVNLKQISNLFNLIILRNILEIEVD